MSLSESDIPTAVRSFKYRLLPSKKQHKALTEILESQRILYNAALQERQDCYRKTGKGRSYIDQCKAVTELRQEDEYAVIPVNIQRWTLKRCDEVYQAFFRRVKTGDKPGFPRYKRKYRWRSFGFNEFSGIRFDGKRLRLKALPGSLRVHVHRPLPDGKILSCVFKKDINGWTVSFRVRISKEQRARTGKHVGIDMGISHLASLSSGEAIPNVRVAKRAERQMRVIQRQLARCKRGSKRRQKVKLKLTRLHARMANTRSTYLHQVSARLIRENDLIAIEALNIKGLAQGILAREVHDASWGELIRQLKYKGENTGVSVIEVRAAGTSQTCPECGQVARKELSQRIHRCDCGCILDRDVAAAQVILQRARSGARVPERKAA